MISMHYKIILTQHRVFETWVIFYRKSSLISWRVLLQICIVQFKGAIVLHNNVLNTPINIQNVSCKQQRKNTKKDKQIERNNSFKN